jgi:hypothetical protein
MVTYNQSITGFIAGNALNTAKLLDVPDANLDGNASATPGGMQGTMQVGDLMLCKGPDGAQHWYKYDAERSTVANPVLIYIGP